jgi:hypothetical protein
MAANYPIQKFRGLEGEELVVHMCRPFAIDKDMVELYTAGDSVVFTKAEFDQMVEWINGQFEKLSKEVRIIN